MIISYTSGKVAGLDRPWTTTPAPGDNYQVLAGTDMMVATHGNAAAGGANTITFNGTGLAVANAYVGCSVYITGGTGAGQFRAITGYTALKVATVSPPWDVVPDTSSIYIVIEAGLPTGQLFIKKNTALAGFEFLMVLGSDHVTPATGLTVTATRSIDKGAFALCANAVSEIGNGIYAIDLAATDLNGTVITLKFAAATADTRYVTIVTQA